MPILLFFSRRNKMKIDSAKEVASLQAPSDGSRYIFYRLTTEYWLYI